MVSERHPTVDVVIVNWNGGYGVIAAARSALRFGASVTVVDNASVDGSAERLIDEVPEARIILLDHNAGFAVASNKGAAAGRGEYVFLLNPDAEIVLGATVDVATAFDHDPSVKIVGSKMVDSEDRAAPSVRQFPTLSALVLYQFKLRRWARRITPLRRYLMVWFPACEPALVDQVMGASFIMRRSDWDRFGGMDERYFLWFEEVDLSRRIALAGGRSLYWPSIVVRHVGGASFAMLSRRTRQRIWNVSMLTYAHRHLGRRAEVILRLTAPASLVISTLLDVSSAVFRSLRRRQADADQRPSLG